MATRIHKEPGKAPKPPLKPEQDPSAFVASETPAFDPLAFLHGESPRAESQTPFQGWRPLQAGKPVLSANPYIAQHQARQTTEQPVRHTVKQATEAKTERAEEAAAFVLPDSKQQAAEFQEGNPLNAPDGADEWLRPHSPKLSR